MKHHSIWTALHNVVFEQKRTDVEGVSTRYAHAGEPGKPAIILLHGTGGSWEAFCRNIGPLSEHFNCFALDMVGSGFTGKPDIPYEIPVYVEHVRGFMDKIGLTSASFIGVSLGSWVACAFALAYPKRSERLILCSASGYISDQQTMARIRSLRSGASEAPSWDSVKTIFDNLILSAENRLPDLIALRLNAYRQPDIKKAMSNILVLQDPEVRSRNMIAEENWRQLRLPVLIVASVDHKDIFYENAVALANIILGARLVEMVGVNHWPQFEDHDYFNQLSVSFLLS